MKQQKGVTLIEMMIVISIIAIVLLFVAPSMQSIIIKNRIVSEINDSSALIQFARHTAINEQALTVVCPSADYATCSTDWNDPKIVFIDEDANSNRGNDETLLVSVEASSDTNVATVSKDIIRFTENGSALNIVEYKICHKDGDATYARGLTINLQGRVKMGKDSDANGIVEDSAGNDLSC
ncbi:GspH/FimT family pseudopilin [Paraglaciecola sp. 2405UD69-4]|uniref:GspH/FimT family pseudopilin n=1 Tax=Paraglaciecola sp. 2405UD69-4 TaxID=3391836 RepID=UPI0039C90804